MKALGIAEMKGLTNTNMDINRGYTHPLRLPVVYKVRIHRSVCASIFGLSAVFVLLSCIMYFDTGSGFLLGPTKLGAAESYDRNTSASEKFEYFSVADSPAPSPFSLYYTDSRVNETLRQNFTLGNGLLMTNSSDEGFKSVVNGSKNGESGIGQTGQLQTKKKSMIKDLGQCDLSVGTWVWDESYPVYQSKNCPFIDGGFRCQENGRPDGDYMKWRWQPSDCDLPRFDARKLLESIRNRRIVFVGDSIGRNQWESMICMLAEVVPNKARIYEVNGNPITKHMGYLSFRFEDYNCTVEYYRSPFLVFQGHPPVGSPPEVRLTLKLDVMDYTSKLWVNGDILVFNTGHWWNYEKTIRGGCYFQEGKTVRMKMNVKTAFQRSMRTWVEWVRRHVNSENTHVFLRSYSPVHFRDGTWKTGGQCHEETSPDLNSSSVWSEPFTNQFMSEAIQQLHGRKNVQFMNITYSAQMRKDGHASVYYYGEGMGLAPMNRQDCSHWCLPGIPDQWNHLLYGYLVARGYGELGTTRVSRR